MASLLIAAVKRLREVVAMSDLLFSYAIRLLDALLILLFVLLIVVLPLVIFLLRFRKKQREQQSIIGVQASHIEEQEARVRRQDSRIRDLEIETARLVSQSGDEYSKQVHNALHHFVGHDFVRGLEFILSKGQETLEGLERHDSGAILRDKQERIVVKGFELKQRARNIVDVFAIDIASDEEVGRELDDVRLDATVQKVMNDRLIYSHAKGVPVKYKPAGAIDPIWANRVDVEQILAIIIDNAIKYSESGKVVMVTLDLHEKQVAGKEVHIDVIDRGKGIPKDEQRKIFELRKRGAGLIEEGSGVGLYYARLMARRYGGDVVLVRSAVNQGSVFRVVFPYPSVEIDDI